MTVKLHKTSTHNHKAVTPYTTSSYNTHPSKIRAMPTVQNSTHIQPPKPSKIREIASSPSTARNDGNLTWIFSAKSTRPLRPFFGAFKRQRKRPRYYHWRKLKKSTFKCKEVRTPQSTFKYDLKKSKSFAFNLTAVQPLIIRDFNPTTFADLWLFYNFVLSPCFNNGIPLVVSSKLTWDEIRQFGLATKDPDIPIPHTWNKIEWMISSGAQMKTKTCTQINFTYKGALDDSQKAAATTADFATQIIAPAGSGKTKVIIARTRYLLDIGVPPEKILICTFNKKAKEELKNRIKAEGLPGNLDVYNFHALGRKILLEETRKKEILHDRVAKIKKFIHKVSTNHKINKYIDPKDVIDEIDRIKLNDLMSPEEYKKIALRDSKKIISEIYKRYEEFKQENDWIDYADMIFMPVKLLIQYKDIRDRWQARYSHILVDEFQDINKTQLILMQIIAAPQDKLFIVGDDDQTIYGWRLADVDRILSLDKEYPLISRIYLKYNYRCPPNIVIAAKKLIENNRHRFKKEITFGKRTETKIEIISYKSSSDKSSKEIDAAATNIIKIIQKEIQNGKELKDFAIISRTHAQLIPLEVACIKNDIFYHLGREHTFLELPEIKTLHCYLTLINDFPKRLNPEILKTILRRPNKYISSSSLQQILKNFESKKDIRSTFFDVKTDESQIRRLINFAEKLDKAYRASKTLSAYESIGLIRQDLGLDEYFMDQQKHATENDNPRIDNLDKYQSMSLDYGCIKDFLDAMNLLKDKAKIIYSEKTSICLQTIHASKGLQFSNLFVFGMDDKHMPHYASLKNAKNRDRVLEEERRLVYVAVTRATDKLYLCVNLSSPSRFIAELFPKEVLQ